MDPETDGKPRHFRGKPRQGRRVSVHYRVRDTRDGGTGLLVPAVTRNIGAGGAFILCPEPQPVGTHLCLRLRLPTSARELEVAAEVRWVIPPGEDPAEAGMGVKFIDLGVDARLALSGYFASLTGSDLPEADP